MARYGPKPSSALTRFWKYVDTSGECWEWTGARNDCGYGVLKTCDKQSKMTRAHRFAWEVAHAVEIPEGMFVLHSCDNPPCVRPDHLRLGGYKENIRDMLERGRCVAANKTHCKHGHPFDAANTRFRSDRPGSRECTECQRIASRVTNARRSVCRRGLHDLTPANTKWSRDGNRRYCIACRGAA